MADFRHAIRALRRSPTFTATAIATLALGIGATSAIFTIVNAALFKPLPYSDPDTLVVLTVPSARDVAGQMFLHVRDRVAPEHDRVAQERDGVGTFESVAAQGGGLSSGWNLAAGDVVTYTRSSTSPTDTSRLTASSRSSAASSRVPKPHHADLTSPSSVKACGAARSRAAPAPSDRRCCWEARRIRSSASSRIAFAASRTSISGHRCERRSPTTARTIESSGDSATA